MDPLMVEAADRLLGALPEDAWPAIEASGFLDALVPAAAGGAGLAPADILPLLLACGRHAVALSVGETVFARAAVAAAGGPVPSGPMRLQDAPCDALVVGAFVTLARMAGAMERVLEETLRHARDRAQFGRPIGAFQAVQQQVSVLVEETHAAAMAARLAAVAGQGGEGCLGLDPLRVAAAKIRLGEAAAEAAAIAHAVCGAMGMTRDAALHRFTGILHEGRIAHGSETYWAERLGRSALQAGGSGFDFARGRLGPG